MSDSAVERFMAWVWRLYLKACRRRVRPTYDTSSDGETNS